MELYLHVPFCRQKCRYCDFASWAGREKQMPSYVDAVISEAIHARQTLEQTLMDTAFIGGGTPSLLPASLLEKLLKGVFACFPLKENAECSCECNPGTLTEPWLDTAVGCGVNRISMGMQAAQEALLRTLGRIHSFAQVEESVKLARRAGIGNLNLDLMFGLPGQTLPEWSETLEAALSLHPEHLSCYGLIPEEGTPLFDALEEGTLTLPEEDTERAMYELTLSRLGAAGFEHYEISNFALPGYACRHNLGYWRQTPYLGLGASAASMLLSQEPDVFCLRRTNPRDLAAYLRTVQDGSFAPAESVPISPGEAQFETMMLGLRTMSGVDEGEFLQLHGVTLQSVYGARLERLAGEGLLAHDRGRWFLTRRGMDVQNALLIELMDN